MKTFFSFLTLICLISGENTVFAQTTPPFIGKWEVLSYSEQGVPVNKKQAALPQAVTVYNVLKSERAHQWYGYDEYTDYSRRENREFRHWMEEDSLRELHRLVEMIARPTYVVFFADSTLSFYTKNSERTRVVQSLSLHYKFDRNFMSLDIAPAIAMSYFGHADGQILFLDEKRMTLYLPETAELVELAKVEFSLP